MKTSLRQIIDSIKFELSHSGGFVTPARLRQAIVEKYPFGLCSCGKEEPKWFNVRRMNFIACEDCKEWWCLGENVLSGWRRENPEIWKKNEEKYGNGDYKEVNGFEVLAELGLPVIAP